MRLRRVRPGDKELLRRGLERLSPESRYRRFFHAKRALSDRELRYLTELDGVRHLALGAVREGPDGEEGLGVARYACFPDRDAVADVAVAVVDDAQGLGLGTLLLRRLAEAAEERGIRAFHLDVLTRNEEMLEVVHALVPDARVRTEAGISTVEFEPGHVREAFAEPADRTEDGDAVRRVFRRIARGELEARPAGPSAAG